MTTQSPLFYHQNPLHPPLLWTLTEQEWLQNKPNSLDQNVTSRYQAQPMETFSFTMPSLLVQIKFMSVPTSGQNYPREVREC